MLIRPKYILIISGVVLTFCTCIRSHQVEENSMQEKSLDDKNCSAASDSIYLLLWKLHEDTQKVLTESVSGPQIRVDMETQENNSSPRQINIFDYYQENLDDYQVDPEDEITYDPEIFDFLDD